MRFTFVAPQVFGSIEPSVIETIPENYVSYNPGRERDYSEEFANAIAAVGEIAGVETLERCNISFERYEVAPGESRITSFIHVDSANQILVASHPTEVFTGDVRCNRRMRQEVRRAGENQGVLFYDRILRALVSQLCNYEDNKLHAKGISAWPIKPYEVIGISHVHPHRSPINHTNTVRTESFLSIRPILAARS